MAPDKLSPDDSRVEHHTATVNGRKYHYLLGKPEGTPKGTILLIHGFPDISLGWRYQIPFLMGQGWQIIAPDQLGYGQTDSPAELEAFSFKSMSSDLIGLTTQVIGPTERVVLGGHDWGGFLVWRITLWYPERVAGVFSICTPYAPPIPFYVDLPSLTKLVPNFGYQLHLAGPEVEAAVNSRDKIRQFLNCLYGGRTPDGRPAFVATQGILLEELETLSPTPLLSSAELDFYADEFSRTGIRGPLNWYRTRKVNYDEEQELVQSGRTRIAQPSLIVSATKDTALPPSMTDGMEQHFDNLVKKQVEAFHWATWQAADEVNAIIKEFLDSVLETSAPKANI